MVFSASLANTGGAARSPKMTWSRTTSGTIRNIPSGGFVIPKNATKPAQMLRELYYFLNASSTCLLMSL